MRIPWSIAALAVFGCGGSNPVTLVPVPDEESRVEVSTSQEDWVTRAGELLACVVRVTPAAECGRTPNPPACDSRSREQVLEAMKPILDSLPKVRLTSRFEMNRQLQGLFPTATPTSEVLDARRRTPCGDWSGGACAAIRTKEVALVFTGSAGAAPERVQIFRVSPACREDRPDGGPTE